MSKKLRYHIHVPDDDGVMQVFGPDDTVPAWAKAKIKNPGAWADEADDEPEPDTGDEAGYSKLKKGELEAEIDKRNADRDPDGESYIVAEQPGNKAELIAALEADDARQAAEGDG